MSDYSDYHSFATAMMADREENFRNALRCLRIVGELIPLDHVVDFGCGIGAWMAAASWLGARRVTGLDGPWVVDILRKGDITFNDGLVAISGSQVIPVDLAENDAPQFSKSYNLAISIEVGEHLPEWRAATLCEGLVNAADYVLFSAATPGQGGYRHINEQPLRYWIDKFWAHGFVPLEVVRPSVAADAWMYFWLRRNIVMFVSYAALLRNHRLLQYAQTPEQIARPWQGS
jgi:hypothetical protein